MDVSDTDGQAIRSVGVIGLGMMGRPIARHLLAGGFAVTACDIDAAAAETVRGFGAAIAGSPRAVAEAAELVIVLTAFEQQVEQVLFGPDGIATAGRAGLVVAIGATIAPTAMRAIAARLEALGIVALDMPICRGERAAEDGALMVIGGGPAAAFERCRAAFATFASDISYLGEAGAGQVGKMVNNLILWACISANHEGMLLGERLGVEREAMRDMLLRSSGQNWALQTRVAELVMPWAEKDMMIVLNEADRARLSLPLCGTVKEVIKGIKIQRGDF